ncbi:FimV family protein, partial [Oleiphilus sp. HI0061]
MIRKLAFALSLLGVLIAESVFALGIGEATVTSALNQPLKAEIELVNSGDFSAEEILPGLATREEFLKANVDRVYFLSDLRFKVETNADGKLVVVLTTNKPVREPFLNFLVEVIWPSGRLLREYALLIDPPL